MREKGFTLQEIADKFECSKQYVNQVLGCCGRVTNVNRTKCIYPNIFSYRRNNNISQEKFAEILGTTQPTLSRYLNGTREIPKSFIDDVLRVTGMTYEEAFKTEE